MTRSGLDWHEVRHHARGLIERCDAAEPGLEEQLRRDLIGTVEHRHDLTVAYAPSGSIVAGCPIAGAYVQRSGHRLPAIVIAHSGDLRRDRFSLGHEFAHHLIDRDDVLADLLFVEPRGRQLEEDICNSAAAYLLVRGEWVDATLQDHGGLTPAAVLALFDLSDGSLEVCCIAHSRRMTEPGYVMLFDLVDDGDVHARTRFAARGGTAPAITPGTRQDHPLIGRAIDRGAAQGQLMLRTPDGGAAGPFAAELLRAGRTLVGTLRLL